MTQESTIDNIRKELAEPIVRWVQEPAARPFVHAFKRTPITPNQVTALSALLAMIAAWFFSLGDAQSMVLGGILFEFSLILDSADGELARAKNMASEWGRIVDGIGDYVSSVAVLIGLMIALPDSRGSLLLMAGLIFLRGVTFDYFKETMMNRVRHGTDGPQRDIHQTFERITRSPSFIMKVYYYYLQLQQLLFRGRWTALNNYASTHETSEEIWSEGQRLKHYRVNRSLIRVWKWHGPDLIFFIIALLSCFAALEPCLPWLSGFMAAQLLVTFTLHHYLIPNEKHT